MCKNALAAIAGIAVGFWKKDEISKNRQTDKIFTPKMDTSEKEKLSVGSLLRKAIHEYLDKNSNQK